MGQNHQVAASQTIMPVIGGIISIGLGVTTLLFVLVPFLSNISDEPPGFIYFRALGGIRAIWLIASIMAIIGGVLAIKRKAWRYAIIGVAGSIVSYGMIPGVIATVLVFKSKKEFDL
ncbi:hypothetical protein DGWBC_1731 [Dehalogenimonas sp. WBC-2]|nr:hypothetical protein DGWBC_1731 [Dehalogenimonas sp. WBC-2]